MSEAITLPRDLKFPGSSWPVYPLRLRLHWRPMANSLRRLAQRENMGTALPTPVEELIAGSTLVKQGAEGVRSLGPRRR